MDDAALVAAARTGDRDAWGLIYDRYAAGLHDHCWSILRDRPEADDALHETFVTTAGALGQLRDPSRLRPWIYAIARYEAVRRHQSRTRAVPTDDPGGDDDGVLGTVTVDLDEGSGAPVDDLRRLVWEAAGGLSAGDQALLDLHLRQALDGDDLAEAMGITRNDADARLAFLRASLERSLGALLVARSGWRDCPALAALVAAGNGELSPQLRTQVAGHIDGCETCAERRRTMVTPLALLAGVPLVPAPAMRRDRILDDAVAVSSMALAAVAAGARSSPPTAATPVVAAIGRGGGRSPWPWVVAVVATLIAIFALAFGVAGGSEGDDGATGRTTTSVDGTTTSSSTTSSTSSTTSTSSTSTTSTTLPIAPGVIALRGGAVDLGPSGTAGSFSIQNIGDTPVSYVLTTSSALLRAIPVTGTVDPGQSRNITVRFDRGAATEGPFVHQVHIDAGAAGQAVATISGAVAPRPPVIGDIESSEPDIQSTCNPANDRTTITANFADESAVASVDLHWESSANGPGSKLMEVGSGTAFAELGPFAAADTITYRVVVTDAFGASATSLPETIDVLGCPDGTG